MSGGCNVGRTTMTGMSEREPRWQVRGDVAWTGSGDRFVAMALATPEKQPLVLEGPAALIWQTLSEGPLAETDVVAQVAELAGIEPEVITDDVAAFLRQLEDAKLASCG